MNLYMGMNSIVLFSMPLSKKYMYWIVIIIYRPIILSKYIENNIMQSEIIVNAKKRSSIVYIVDKCYWG